MAKATKRLIMLSTDANLLVSGSGVEKRIERYAALGYDLRVILFSPRRSKSFELNNGQTSAWVYPVHSFIKPFAWIKSFFLMTRLARRGDVITAQDPFEVGLMALAVSSVKKCALHVQVHIDFYDPYFRSESARQKFQSWLAPFVLRHAHGVRAVSKRIAAHLTGSLGIESSRVMTVPVFVDPRKVENTPVTIDLRTRYPQFDRVFLMASRLVPQKNISLAIYAFARFHRAHRAAGLVIIGSGAEEQVIQDLVREYGLGDSVVIAPLTQAFISAMKTCDYFLLTSDYEGWGMTVVEAASCGKPIIMTDVGCAGEFARDDKEALIIPTRDARALVLSMEKVYSDDALAERLGNAAKSRAESYMTETENDRLLREGWEKAIARRNTFK